MIELFYFDGSSVKTAPPEDLLKLRKKRIWVNSTAITQQESELLKEAFGLHPLTVEDLQHTLTRVKIEEFSNYLFCVFYGIRKIDRPELQEIDLILGKNFIITNQQQELGSTEELKTHPQKLFNFFSRGVDFVFYRILDSEVDNFFPVLEDIDEEIEKIDALIKQPHPGLSLRIITLKRNISEIRKTVITQREKVSFLAKEEYNFISKKAIPYFRDIYDHSIRVADELEYYREAINGTFDAYMSSVSLRMSDIMKVLSVITTLAMPMTVISSIYGTNFKVLPGAGSVYGFWIMLIIILLFMLGLVYFFKKRRWF